jgi:hypothetical protein
VIGCYLLSYSCVAHAPSVRSKVSVSICRGLLALNVAIVRGSI